MTHDTRLEDLRSDYTIQTTRQLGTIMTARITSRAQLLGIDIIA